MIGIWISRLDRVGLIVMPYRHAILYEADTVPKRPISKYPEQYTGLT